MQVYHVAGDCAPYTVLTSLSSNVRRRLVRDVKTASRVTGAVLRHGQMGVSTSQASPSVNDTKTSLTLPYQYRLAAIERIYISSIAHSTRCSALDGDAYCAVHIMADEM